MCIPAKIGGMAPLVIRKLQLLPKSCHVGISIFARVTTRPLTLFAKQPSFPRMRPVGWECYFSCPETLKGIRDLPKIVVVSWTSALAFIEPLLNGWQSVSQLSKHGWPPIFRFPGKVWWPALTVAALLWELMGCICSEGQPRYRYVYTLTAVQDRYPHTDHSWVQHGK